MRRFGVITLPRAYLRREDFAAPVADHGGAHIEGGGLDHHGGELSDVMVGQLQQTKKRQDSGLLDLKVGDAVFVQDRFNLRRGMAPERMNT